METKISFRARVYKATLLFMLGFTLLFVFRFIYSYTSKGTERDPEYFADFFNDFQSSRKNYASDSYKYSKQGSFDSKPQAMDVAPAVKEISVSQKYEKTATVKSKSDKFENDEKKLRSSIKDFNGIIQFEENSGNKGNRSLHLLIGIPPAEFDTFYVAVCKIGNLRSKEITKTDKTNEYRTLNAQKASLEKIRTSLIELKKQNGRIDELISLENRILEIEEKLQDLGVSLGDYDEENEFCTVRYSINEGKVIPVGTMHRLKTVFEWTVTFYLQFSIIVVLCSFSAFFILLIIEKLKVLTNIVKKLNE